MRITLAVRALVALELRTLLRDPRTVLMSVVLPVVLIPALLLIGSQIEDRRAERAEQRTFQLALVGEESQFAAELVESLRDVRAVEDGPGFRLVEIGNPREALDAGSIDLYLEAFSTEEWRELVEAEGIEGDAISLDLDGIRVLRISYHSTRTASREGAERLSESLLDRHRTRRDSILVQAGFAVPSYQVAVVEGVDVASERQVQGARLGRYLTLILLGLMVLGGSVVATDTLAGEKERGTLATLLTSAVSRTEIVAGKLLAVMGVALAIALVQLVNLWVFLGTGLIDPLQGFAVDVSPGLVAALLLLYLPVVALVAGVLLVTSAHANSYKEAQLYLMPVLLVLVTPAMAPLMPGLSLQSAAVLIPIANLSLGVRDLLAGNLQLAWLAAAWLVTAGAAAWVTTRSVQALHDEGLVTGDTSREDSLEGPELFPKRILRWILVLWAIKLLLELNLRFEDIRMGILLGVGLVFLAFPLLMIRRFRLDPVEALALRFPRPGVWAGVALGAPAGLVAAGTVLHLMDFVVPVPTEALESFGQALVPDEVPVWQLVLLFAIVPGITEELTFRGVLLHGLRRRFGGVALALVVGMIFGLFHYELFRIPVTTFLGVILTAVALLTGSILPAIAWHTLHNGLAAYLATSGIEFGGEEWLWGAGSFLILALALWIIWVCRTPYPGVGEGSEG